MSTVLALEGRQAGGTSYEVGGDATLEAEDKSGESRRAGGGTDMGLTIGRIVNPTINVIWLGPSSRSGL